MPLHLDPVARRDFANAIWRTFQSNAKQIHVVFMPSHVKVIVMLDDDSKPLDAEGYLGILIEGHDQYTEIKPKKRHA